MSHLENVMLVIGGLEMGIVTFGVDWIQTADLSRERANAIFWILVAALYFTAIAYLHYASVHLRYVISTGSESILRLPSWVVDQTGENKRLLFSWKICVLFPLIVYIGATWVFSFLLLVSWVSATVASIVGARLLFFGSIRYYFRTLNDWSRDRQVIT